MLRSKFNRFFSFLLLVSLLAASPAGAANLTAKIKKSPDETVIYVDDLHCKNCAKKIASKLFTVKGVLKVRTDLKTDVVVVTPQKKKKLDPQAIWSAAQASGFPAMKLVGPSGTYVPHPETKAAQKLTDEEAAAANQG